MDFGLNGKRALITASTAGIGFAAARAIAEKGARVIVVNNLGVFEPLLLSSSTVIIRFDSRS